ncbi:DgyrCDS5217 [Dimorphilus gyrociliatus]|uniref:DgyrCDS5217 n=1 Tax=Dimorphilus gyrociliatus TaxID=2664684 RepID=A0A7I8VKU0_9ANNE|nr:DgyrCDS5217 [Dimorphilus gyrociliatus]
MDEHAICAEYPFSYPEPYLEIIEEPRQKGQRFRYECEGRYAGHIPGEKSTEENKSYPTIRLCNMGNATEAIIVASCVTRDKPYRAHPHSLVGKECNKGVCTVKLKNGETTYKFQNLGIRCAKKRAVKDKLQERQQIRVDPYGNGFDHINDPSNIDAHCVRICFQAFLPDPESNNQFRKVVPPIVTQPIFDHKTPGEMKICRVSACAGSVNGGTEIFMLTDKLTSKDDVEIIFECKDWMDKGNFGSTDVHHQVAIVFKTPPFPFQITEPCKVFMYLKRMSEDLKSEPIEFTYHPNNDYEMSIKRKKKSPLFSGSEFQCSSSTVSDNVKERVIKKITKGKGATPTPTIPVTLPTFPYEDQLNNYDRPAGSTVDPSVIDSNHEFANTLNDDSNNYDPMLATFTDFLDMDSNNPNFG